MVFEGSGASRNRARKAVHVCVCVCCSCYSAKYVLWGSGEKASFPQPPREVVDLRTEHGEEGIRTSCFVAVPESFSFIPSDSDHVICPSGGVQKYQFPIQEENDARPSEELSRKDGETRSPNPRQILQATQGWVADQSKFVSLVEGFKGTQEHTRAARIHVSAATMSTVSSYPHASFRKVVEKPHASPSWVVGGFFLAFTQVAVESGWISTGQAEALADQWRDGGYFFTIWITSSCSIRWLSPTRWGLYLVLVPLKSKRRFQ